MEPLYTITFDFDDTVIGLCYTDSGGYVTARENGTWVPLDGPEDGRYFNNPFTNVTEEAVEIFDQLSKSGRSMSLSSFSGVEIV